MDEQLQAKFAGFAFYLVKAGEGARCALDDEDLMAALAARGIPRSEIEKLAEVSYEISQCFYNEPKPV